MAADEVAEDRREAGREEDRSWARRLVGVAVLLGGLAGDEMADPLKLKAEQQDEAPAARTPMGRVRR